jgi:two-component system cell cycle response regulator CpdR
MLRLLLVEDNAELRDTFVLLLEGEQRTIDACASAEEALQRFEAAPYDVVLTDVNLPKLSGLELARRVHALAPRTWIVLSSGGAPAWPADVSRERLRFLAKPFSIEALEALLAEFEGRA